MPRHTPTPLPPGYDLRGSPGAWYLLRQSGPLSWEEIAGPLKQRWYAVRKAERDAAKHAPAVSRARRQP